MRGHWEGVFYSYLRAEAAFLKILFIEIFFIKNEGEGYLVKSLWHFRLFIWFQVFLQTFYITGDTFKIFCGSAGGRRVFAGSRPSQKSFIAQKMDENRRFWTKLDPESEWLILACSLSFQILNCSVLWSQKFCVMLRRSPATYERLKRGTFFWKGQKNEGKS